MGYSDETWCVGSGGQKYYGQPQHGLSSPNVHIKYPIAYLFWLAKNNKGITGIQSSVWA